MLVGWKIELDLLLNDLSFHGQFFNLSDFLAAIDRLMAIRTVSQRFGRKLHCHRNIAYAQVTPQAKMPQAVAALNKDKRRALMAWLNKHGPFWEDERQHDPEDVFECDGDIVTDTALGEAAWLHLKGNPCAVVSLNPSSWLIAPLSVGRHENGFVRKVAVPNFWDSIVLEAALATAPVPLTTWTELEKTVRIRFTNLTFSQECFEPLFGTPFGRGPAEQLLRRFSILNIMPNCFDKQGERTPEGNRLYKEHFIGQKAWFSDSSETEKSKFREDLTFLHPSRPGDFLFCTWHAKVKTPQLRVHFSWPIRAGEPVYIVYVGPKITKR